MNVNRARRSVPPGLLRTGAGGDSRANAARWPAFHGNAAVSHRLVRTEGDELREKSAGGAALEHCDGSDLSEAELAEVNAGRGLVAYDAFSRVREHRLERGWHSRRTSSAGRQLQRRLDETLNAGDNDWTSIRLKELGGRRSVGGFLKIGERYFMGPLSLDIGRGDIGRGDIGRGDIGRGDIGRGDIGRGDIGRGDIGRGDIGRGDIGRGDIGRGDIGRGDIGRGDFGGRRHGRRRRQRVQQRRAGLRNVHRRYRRPGANASHSLARVSDLRCEGIPA